MILLVNQLPHNFQKMVFETIIPRNIKLGEAPSFGKPAILYDGESKGAISYLNLATEIVNRQAAQHIATSLVV